MLILPFWQMIYRFFYPPFCLLCRQKCALNSAICMDCRRDLPWPKSMCYQCGIPLFDEQMTTLRLMYCGACVAKPPPFIRTIVLFNYQFPIIKLITQLKFQHQLRNAQILAKLLAEQVRQSYGNQSLPQCIIPIPLHQQRLRQRGFNQALEIAKYLAWQLSIPLLVDACYRRKLTMPQTRLSAKQRRHNLKGAFVIKKNIHWQNVAIVDDVMTTGQTVEALCKLLKKHGVKTVHVWCCARAILK